MTTRLSRFGGVLLLLFSAVGIVGFTGGIVGVWIIHHMVSEKVQTTSARLEVGVERASAATQNVQRAIERARADVATVHKESADVGGGGEKGNRASRALRKLIQQHAAPTIDHLGGRLATLSDAAVALSSLLETVQELPTGPKIQVEPDLLKRRADEAHQLSARLRRLEAALGDGEKGTGGREVAATTNEVDSVLEKCQLAVDRWQSDLGAARQTLARVHSEMVPFLRYGAIAMTVLCVWAATGQVSLFRRALEWLKPVRPPGEQDNPSIAKSQPGGAI
jgi:hypothetical protein